MPQTYKKGIYIIGAGFAGRMLSEEIQRKKLFGQLIAFLDDNPEKIGKTIDGVPVLGPIAHFSSVLRHSSRDEAIIAIPSAPKERIAEIYDVLARAQFSRIRILPSVSQIIDGDAHLIQTREINPLDILGRNPVRISLKESLGYLRGKRVLITGAGGSIGSELARQLLSGGASRLYLFGHGENSIYLIDKELRILQKEGVGEAATIIPVIGELKDRDYMFWIMKNLKCDVVFHCAAYKHVPLMEENPVAVIENNVFGTKNLLDASLEANVERFVLISTDKAVKPHCIYGVSKHICENLLIDAAKKAKKDQAFMFVRFGNVMGSRGSILPLFSAQLASGGPLTVTDPEVKRFFMTIPEASSLVLQAGGVGKNEGAYLLDMGEAIKILDIAEEVIRIQGYEPYKDVQIEFIGLRKGERMEEFLWTDAEAPEKTKYEKLLSLKPVAKASELTKLLDLLEPICMYKADKPELYRNQNALYKILKTHFQNLDIKIGIL